MFSLDDMIKTRAGEMAPLLTRVISLGLVHVSECSLCQARGHICTICNSDSVIFPFMVKYYFDIDNIVRTFIRLNDDKRQVRKTIY